MTGHFHMSSGALPMIVHMLFRFWSTPTDRWHLIYLVVCTTLNSRLEALDDPDHGERNRIIGWKGLQDPTSPTRVCDSML